ncbi:hypothetical protein [Noviherbaspirillum soli]|uniref:hypothetical protein n=1 Tax=Noviherbaspirillum soli TaxID=1064518 RepID=UPI00188BBD03|nr:hypothetical protein [Noviherbaspirillum soli]
MTTVLTAEPTEHPCSIKGWSILSNPPESGKAYFYWRNAAGVVSEGGYATAEQADQAAGEEARRAWRNVFAEDAVREGWDIFDVDGRPDLQRCDEVAVFQNDFEAWCFVVDQAERHPASAAALALAVLPVRYRNEIVQIVKDNTPQGIRPVTTANQHPAVPRQST